MASDPPDKKDTEFIVEDYVSPTQKSAGQGANALEDLTTVLSPEADKQKGQIPPSVDGQYEDLTSLPAVDGQYEDLTEGLLADTPIDESLFDEIIAGSTVEAGLESDLALFAEPVLLGLANRELEATLTAPFSPFDRAVSLQPSAESSYTKFDFSELDYIGLISIPKDLAGIGRDMVTEVVETFGGKSEKVEVYSGQDFDTGLFCLAGSQTGRFKYLYFPYDSIKFRYQARPLGEIMLESGLVTEPVLQEVLLRQKKMRNVTLGQILAKQANLDQATIDAELRNAWRDNPDSAKTLAGKILVDSGMVTEKQLEDAVKFQNQLRKKRIGEMLIELKHVSEEQVYGALAVKFRKSFVQLQAVSPSEEASASMPRELALKLRLLPLSIDRGRLLVATATPEMPELPVHLRKYLRCSFELVVATPSQLKTAIIKKYSN
ncbi:MAG: hypothetical protein A2511_08840 [Deltaproteobacteria bacterium RIFOXYD12_FULL_50_9]|nr:MAG: hypothetical protein A2511_08840 [Deltaproteobacteria bacterium RIFOXYD12_FULL_50_9]